MKGAFAARDEDTLRARRAEEVRSAEEREELIAVANVGVLDRLKSRAATRHAGIAALLLLFLVGHLIADLWPTFTGERRGPPDVPDEDTRVWYRDDVAPGAIYTTRVFWGFAGGWVTVVRLVLGGERLLSRIAVTVALGLLMLHHAFERAAARFNARDMSWTDADRLTVQSVREHAALVIRSGVNPRRGFICAATIGAALSFRAFAAAGARDVSYLAAQTLLGFTALWALFLVERTYVWEILTRRNLTTIGRGAGAIGSEDRRDVANGSILAIAMPLVMFVGGRAVQLLLLVAGTRRALSWTAWAYILAQILFDIRRLILSTQHFVPAADGVDDDDCIHEAPLVAFPVLPPPTPAPAPLPAPVPPRRVRPEALVSPVRGGTGGRTVARHLLPSGPTTGRTASPGTRRLIGQTLGSLPVPVKPPPSPPPPPPNQTSASPPPINLETITRAFMCNASYDAACDWTDAGHVIVAAVIDILSW